MTEWVSISAALADFVYHRSENINAADQALTLTDIGAVKADLSLLPSLNTNLSDYGFQLSGDGFFYNSATGFVGTIVKQDDKHVVVLRGTDMGTASFLDLVISYFTSVEPGKLDNNDMNQNFALSEGTILEQSQLKDALNLAEMAKELAGDSWDNVIVAGQSLGGGLASLVGAIRGVETYAISPAPFKKALSGYADHVALAQTHTDYQGNLTQTFLDLPEHVQATYLAGGIPGPLRDQLIAAGPGQDVNTLANDIHLAFNALQNPLLTQYNNNATTYLNTHTIKGEALSAEWAGVGLSSLATHFEAPDVEYDIGEGSVAGLHGPSVHALAIKTHGSVQSLANLLTSDAQLRYLLINDVAASGPLGHKRTDQVVNSSSQMDLGYPDAAILFRALWKSVGADSNAAGGNLWDYFFTLYKNVLSGHTAADGLQANDELYEGTEPNLHGGILKLSLSILRDALQNTQTLDDVKGNIKANLGLTDNTVAFAGSNPGNSTPRNDRVILDLAGITQLETTDQGGSTKPFQEPSGKALGVADIEATIVQELAEGIFASTSGFSASVNQLQDTATYLGSDYLQILNRTDAFLQTWDVLVVHGGHISQGLAHNALTDDNSNLADKSHVIIGGKWNDYLTGSNSNDYLITGKESDFSYSSNGNDYIAAGEGDDTFFATGNRNLAASTTFMGGSGFDTADYLGSGSAITVKLIQETIGNQTVDGFQAKSQG